MWLKAWTFPVVLAKCSITVETNVFLTSHLWTRIKYFVVVGIIWILAKRVLEKSTKQAENGVTDALGLFFAFCWMRCCPGSSFVTFYKITSNIFHTGTTYIGTALIRSRCNGSNNWVALVHKADQEKKLRFVFYVDQWFCWNCKFKKLHCSWMQVGMKCNAWSGAVRIRIWHQARTNIVGMKK